MTSLSKATARNAAIDLSAADRLATATLPQARGLGAWIAVVRTYQKCSDTLTALIKPLGLKLAQHDVLMNLLLQGALSQQALAEKSFVTKSHMSAVLGDMLVKGWIKRSDSTTDKRSKIIRLTPQGTALARRSYAAQLQVVDAMMAPLSDRQVHELERISLGAIVALDTLHAARQAAS